MLTPLTNNLGTPHTSGSSSDLGTNLENIIFFGGESTSTQEDLPWIKDWVKITKSPGEPKEVITIYSGDKGLLMETGEYKSFIFRRESTYGYLVEALETWVKTKEEVIPLIVAATTKGKAQYGLHQDKPKIVWLFDDGKYKSIRVDGKLTAVKLKSNPFLQSNSPAHGAVDDEKGSSDHKANDELATPRRAKKGD